MSLLFNSSNICFCNYFTSAKSILFFFYFTLTILRLPDYFLIWNCYIRWCHILEESSSNHLSMQKFIYVLFELLSKNICLCFVMCNINNLTYIINHSNILLLKQYQQICNNLSNSSKPDKNFYNNVAKIWRVGFLYTFIVSSYYLLLILRALW